MFSPISFIDPTLISLTEEDIDYPCAVICMENISSYSIEHLKKWLLYRKDALRGLTSLKDVQVRVLQYFNAGNQKHVVDPTPDKK